MPVNARGALRDLIAAGLPDRASALTLYAAVCGSAPSPACSACSA